MFKKVFKILTIIQFVCMAIVGLAFGLFIAVFTIADVIATKKFDPNSNFRAHNNIEWKLDDSNLQLTFTVLDKEMLGVLVYNNESYEIIADSSKMIGSFSIGPRVDMFLSIERLEDQDNEDYVESLLSFDIKSVKKDGDQVIAILKLEWSALDLETEYFKEYTLIGTILE